MTAVRWLGKAMRMPSARWSAAEGKLKKNPGPGLVPPLVSKATEKAPRCLWLHCSWLSPEPKPARAAGLCRGTLTGCRNRMVLQHGKSAAQEQLCSWHSMTPCRRTGGHWWGRKQAGRRGLGGPDGQTSAEGCLWGKAAIAKASCKRDCISVGTAIKARKEALPC